MFYSTLTTDPLEFKLFREGRACNVLVHVGHDLAEGWNWFVSVGLDTMAGGDLEYYFVLLRVDAETGEVTPYRSGREVRAAIPPGERKAIRATILQATQFLLGHARPPRVYRVTYDVDPPDRALEKHHAISQVFEECGYAVATADAVYGQRFWWMELRTPSPLTT